MKIVDIDNVTKKYKGKIVLNQISFQIERGEIFGLLGPSGVGKSTLIKLITGQTKADNGMVSVFGNNTFKWDNNNNNRLGIMIDNIGLCERMTCFENLMLYCKILNIPLEDAKEWLKKVGLSDASGKLVTELSKGMKQRLLFARAMLNSPELVILDEPTSDLDPQTTLKIHNAIKDFRESKGTVILATHNMQEAFELCDRIGIVYEGKMIELGTPKEICEKYNLQTQIVIVDKQGEEHMFENCKESANSVIEFIEKEDINDLYMKKIGLKDIFLQLTEGK